METKSAVSRGQPKKISVRIGTHEGRQYAEAEGTRCYIRGSSDPICKLARVLRDRGLDPARILYIFASDGSLRMWGATLGWWADYTTMEGTYQSVRIGKYVPFSEKDD